MKMGTKTPRSVGLKYGTGPQETARNAHYNETLAATIRYNDEKQIKPETELELQDTDGRAFGRATVEYSTTLLAACALEPVRAYNAAYGISTVPELLVELNRYYSKTITAETPVKVIVYDPHEITE